MLYHSEATSLPNRIVEYLLEEIAEFPAWRLYFQARSHPKSRTMISFKESFKGAFFEESFVRVNSSQISNNLV